MSQAKTQMPNKSFGLNNNTSVQSADDSNWSDGLGHFRSSNSTNTGDPSMNWSSSGTNINAVKLIASNSVDLWSSENHNNFNQNLDDLLKTDKNNKISSNSHYHQSANHSQFLKSQNTAITNTNKWNNNGPVNSSLNYNGISSGTDQQQHLRNSNNQFSVNNSLGNQSIDLISNNTWSPFSSNPIGSQQPNRPPSSASTASSTNNSESINQNSFPNHSHSSNNANNYAQQQQWSQQQQHQQQNGWSNNSESSDFNSNEWQPQQTMSNPTQQQHNNAQNSPSQVSSSISNHSSATITNIVRGGTGASNSLAPPPVVPAPPAPTNSASQAASSAKSWAKIVSQQSSPSTPASTTTSTASTTTQQSTASNTISNATSSGSSLSNSAPTPPTQNSSNNSSQSLSQSANSQQFNNNFNSTNKSVPGNNQSNKNSNEMNHEWNIKVNQSVPWEMENQLRLNNIKTSQQNTTTSNSSSNVNNQFSLIQSQATTNNSTSSSLGSSNSPANGLIMPNQPNNNNNNNNNIDTLMNNLNSSQQNKNQQSQRVDTGTDIWLSNNNHANKPKQANWDNSQPVNMAASGNSSNSQSSSSSPNTTMNHSGNSNWNNQQQQGSNTQWNTGQRWNNNAGQQTQNENFVQMNNNQKASNEWNQNNSWMDNSGRSNPGQQLNKPLGNSSTSSTSSTSSQPQMPLNETTNQISRWNQQTPPPYSTPLSLAGNGTENQPIISINNATLVCQAANLKLSIEPQGWEDPDFKIAKKNDDGTNIWGDPEHQRMVKVTKWMHVTRHMPNKQANSVSQPGPMSEQENQLVQPLQQQTFGANSGSPTDGSSQQWNVGQSSGSQTSKILQQSMSASSWSNTPAAPLSLSNNESLNQNDSTINSTLNEWAQDQIDTKSWSSFKDTKNNFDPSVGIIDTSKWQATNGNQVSQQPQSIASTNGQLMPPNGNVNGLKLASSATDWSNSTSPFNGNRDDILKQPLSRSVNNMSNANNNNNMMNSIGRIPNMNSSASNSNINQQLLNNPQMQNKNNLNLNLMQNQNMMQNQNIGSPQNLMGSSNANSNLNNMIMNNSGNTNSSNQTLNPSPQPQVQNQLIESFRLAVSSGLISPDILNTKLPQDVLTLLYQLFQTLTNYIATNNKLNDLNKRRGQMLPGQFKAENDLLTMDAQNMKSTLVTIQNKIHHAHQILKQSNSSNNNQTSGNKQSGSPLTPGLSTPPNSVELAAAAAGVPLNDLPILKDPSNTQMNNLNAQQQRSKLLQLLNESSNESTKAFSRQASHQPGNINQQHNKFQSQFSQPANFLGNNSSMGSQWSNFDSGMMSINNGQVDDRITPFIPGQLWAGSQSSIEDDPNCTPGSVSKPLLTETIDPEIILNSLQRGSNWSNFSDNLLNSNLGNMGMIGNNANNRSNPNNGRTNSSNLNNNSNNQNWGMSTNNSNNINGGSIGEQLWGVGVGSRSASRGGNTGNITISQSNNVTNMAGNVNNRNSNSFGGNNNQMINQQQFFRNNGNNNNNNWNSQQTNSQMNNQNSNNSNQNFPINSGNYILIRNVPAHVDQATLKALCSQHASGQLTYYRYIQQMTCVIVRYNTKEEANNAQNKLNSVSLGNTTIFTQPLNENDLK